MLLVCVICVLEYQNKKMDAPLNVVVPPGTGPGGVVEFEGPDGTLLQAVVPEGLSEGDTFQVTVDSAGNVEILREIAEAMQGRSDIMSVFVAWFEREAVGEQVDSFLRENAARIGVIDASGEQSHDWWPLYQEYQARFEALLQQFLQEAQCTQEEFLEEAQHAEGMNEIYVQLFLSHSEYEMFVELISHEATRQAAGAED